MLPPYFFMIPFLTNYLPLLGSIRATLDQPVFPGKVIVWLLFMLSIIGWVMIVSKIVQLNKIKRTDRDFTERLRKSKTTLEVFEEGWDDDLSLKHVIYQAGAREAAFQYLGSREPQEMMQRRIKQAGKLGTRQLEFLRTAFQTGYRAALGRLQSGIDGLRILSASSLLLGSFGLVWTLMMGFDSANEFAEIAPMVGGALGYLVIALLVATPAAIAKIAFDAAVRSRERELERFRDDINRLFERSFAETDGPIRQTEAGQGAEAASGMPDGPRENRESAPSLADSRSTGPTSMPAHGPVSASGNPPVDGKKRYHSIRERLLREDNDDVMENHFEVNPIARQAAVYRGF